MGSKDRHQTALLPYHRSGRKGGRTAQKPNQGIRGGKEAESSGEAIGGALLSFPLSEKNKNSGKGKGALVVDRALNL